MLKLFLHLWQRLPFKAVLIRWRVKGGKEEVSRLWHRRSDNSHIISRAFVYWVLRCRPKTRIVFGWVVKHCLQRAIWWKFQLCKFMTSLIRTDIYEVSQSFREISSAAFNGAYVSSDRFRQLCSIFIFRKNWVLSKLVSLQLVNEKKLGKEKMKLLLL